MSRIPDFDEKTAKNPRGEISGKFPGNLLEISGTFPEKIRDFSGLFLGFPCFSYVFLVFAMFWSTYRVFDEESDFQVKNKEIRRPEAKN